MGRMKEITELQDAMFQSLEALYQAKANLNLKNYKLALGTLDILNHDFKEITGNYFIEEKRIMSYYSDMWEIENWKKF